MKSHNEYFKLMEVLTIHEKKKIFVYRHPIFWKWTTKNQKLEHLIIYYSMKNMFKYKKYIAVLIIFSILPQIYFLAGPQRVFELFSCLFAQVRWVTVTHRNTLLCWCLSSVSPPNSQRPWRQTSTTSGWSAGVCVRVHVRERGGEKELTGGLSDDRTVFLI